MQTFAGHKLTSRNQTILTVAKAKSPVFSEVYAEIAALFKAAGKVKKSSHTFGVAIEAYHARRQNGNLSRFTTEHTNRHFGTKSYSWNLDALLTIDDERAAGNTHLHNLFRNELTKLVTKPKRTASVRVPRKAKSV